MLVIVKILIIENSIGFPVFTDHQFRNGRVIDKLFVDFGLIFLERLKVFLPQLFPVLRCQG